MSAQAESEPPLQVATIHVGLHLYLTLQSTVHSHYLILGDDAEGARVVEIGSGVQYRSKFGFFSYKSRYILVHLQLT